MTRDEKKALMRLQIEQLTSFLDAAYAGLVSNLRITWDYEWDDEHGKSEWSDKIKADKRSTYGRHTEITIATPTWHGSMGGDLSEQAYGWREKLIDKLDDDKRAKAAAAMNAEYGPDRREKRP